jgi:hypothetical protein
MKRVVIVLAFFELFSGLSCLVVEHIVSYIKTFFFYLLDRAKKK